MGVPMHRVVLLICALILLDNLCDDGQLGKASYVAPSSPAQSLAVSGDHLNAGVADWHHLLVCVSCQSDSSESRAQTILPFDRQPCKLLIFSHYSTAGGLPG
jgi:hypothetical protein